MFPSKKSAIHYAQETNLSQMLLHDLGAVVDGKNDICDTSFGKGLNLVQDHALVAKFHQWLGECEGLRAGSLLVVGIDRCAQARSTMVRCRVGLGARRSNQGIDGLMHTRGRRRVPKPPTRIRAAKG
jgi:hypothetical protein